MPQVAVVTVQPRKRRLFPICPAAWTRCAMRRSRPRDGHRAEDPVRTGGDVKENQVLFKIDPASYQASYDQATAQLKQAQADLYSAKLLADRYAPLVKANAVSKQEYDNAVASYRQADAAVAAAKAAQTSASINLGYTDVTSPITGRIGKPLVTEGRWSRRARPRRWPWCSNWIPSTSTHAVHLRTGAPARGVCLRPAAKARAGRRAGVHRAGKRLGL